MVSARYSGIQPPEGPPNCTALNSLSSEIPPPSLKIISWIDIPMGTSTAPPCFIFPVKAKTFVPLLFSVPYFENDSAPFKIIYGILAKVSTLLIFEGFPHKQASEGNGGRLRGIPLSPSTYALSAVSSPQTKAPSPSFTYKSK